MNIQNRL